MQELICDGAPTTDTDLWMAELDKFCKERFQDDMNTLEQQEQIIRNLGFCPHRLDSNKHLIPNFQLQQSRATMRHNKATDKKGIANEMLHSISYHSRLHLHQLFQPIPQQPNTLPTHVEPHAFQRHIQERKHEHPTGTTMDRNASNDKRMVPKSKSRQHETKL